MPKCVPCLGRDFKEAILQSYPGFRDIVDAIEDCPDSRDIQVCHREERGRGGRRGRSAYNVFIGQCMKGRVKSFGQAPTIMKECAGQWRARKQSSR